MFTIHVYKSTTREFTVDLFEDDGTTAIVLQADDEVRCKVGRGSDTPDLDISSIEALSGGSIVTFTAGTNDVCIKIAQSDLSSLPAGAYDMQVVVIDNSDEIGGEKAAKHVEYGICFIHPSAGGDFDDEQSSSSSG